MRLYVYVHVCAYICTCMRFLKNTLHAGTAFLKISAQHTSGTISLAYSYAYTHLQLAACYKHIRESGKMDTPDGTLMLDMVPKPMMTHNQPIT